MEMMEMTLDGDGKPTALVARTHTLKETTASRHSPYTQQPHAHARTRARSLNPPPHSFPLFAALRLVRLLLLLLLPSFTRQKARQLAERLLILVHPPVVHVR